MREFLEAKLRELLATNRFWFERYGTWPETGFCIDYSGNSLLVAVRKNGDSQAWYWDKRKLRIRPLGALHQTTITDAIAHYQRKPEAYAT